MQRHNVLFLSKVLATVVDITSHCLVGLVVHRASQEHAPVCLHIQYVFTADKLHVIFQM